MKRIRDNYTPCPHSVFKLIRGCEDLFYAHLNKEIVALVEEGVRTHWHRWLMVCNAQNVVDTNVRLCHRLVSTP